MKESANSIAQNLAAIQERIAEAAQRAGRRPEEITLVGISKTVPAERIREAFQAGVRHFGESRVKDWEEKAPQLQDLSAVWHMVGHLQRNKAARALTLFHRMDALDSLPLAEKLNQAAGEGRQLPVLLEVRMDSSPKKSGCNPEEIDRMAEGVLLLPHLDLCGLMTVPPASESPEDSRPVFKRLREMRDALSNTLKKPMPELSMGMSHDFEIAIEEGATQIRVGTALFGLRPRKE